MRLILPWSSMIPTRVLQLSGGPIESDYQVKNSLLLQYIAASSIWISGKRISLIVMFHTIFGPYLRKMHLLFIWHLNLSGYLGGFPPLQQLEKPEDPQLLIIFNAYDKRLCILTELQLCKVIIGLPVLDTAPGYSELSTDAETQATSVGSHSKYRQNPSEAHTHS